MGTLPATTGSLPAELDFVRDPTASPARMTQAMALLDTRLRALEVPARTFDQVLAQLQAIGLQRINEALQPVYARLLAIAQVGALFATTSASSVAVGLGPKTFVVAMDDWERFAAAGILAAVSRDNPDILMTGPVVAFDRATGMLTLNATVAAGAGMVTGWALYPATLCVLPQSVDPGFYDAPNGSAASAPVVSTGGIGTF